MYGYGDWFIPRLYTQSTLFNNAMGNGTVEDGTLVHFANEIANETISVLAGAVVEEFKIRAQHPSAAMGRNLTGSIDIGAAWLKSLFGRSQWTLPCVNVVVRL